MILSVWNINVCTDKLRKNSNVKSKSKFFFNMIPNNNMFVFLTEAGEIHGLHGSVGNGKEGEFTEHTILLK